MIDLDAAEPDHGDNCDVHHHGCAGEDEHEEVTYAATRVHDLLIRILEALALNVFAHERAHDANTGELLAQDSVDVVEPFLIAAEQRRHAPHDEDHEREQNRGRDRDDPAEPNILSQRHNHATDREHRRGHHHRAGHEDEHLHLLDVVRVAGDERARAKAAQLAF